MYYPRICLEGLSKATTKSGQSPKRQLSPGPQEYEDQKMISISSDFFAMTICVFLVPVLSHTNNIYTLTPNLFKIHFDINLPIKSRPRLVPSL
jgi:hypothetical protein